jgi:hypothetical protein
MKWSEFSRSSKVFWFEPCHLGEAGQHARADFVTVMKSENDVRPSGLLQDFVRTGDAFDLPSEAKEGGKNAWSLR